MAKQEKKSKLLSCMITSPGPIYKLPTLTGYREHDPSRCRNPAYSLTNRTNLMRYPDGPAPIYGVGKFTNRGMENSPAFSIAQRLAPKKLEGTPGPGAHQPEICPPMNHNKRSPAYTMRQKLSTNFSDDLPGPNAYFLPTCIGPKVPDKLAQAAFTIANRGHSRLEDSGPGPAGYSYTNPNIVKRRFPAYSIKFRNDLITDCYSPAPKYYPKYNGKAAAKYSFGMKHSPCAGVAITNLDEE